MHNNFYVKHKFLFIINFNAEESEPCFLHFSFKWTQKKIVKKPNCYKNVSNPSCVGLVITNNSSSLQNTNTVSAGLLDFHKMVSIVLKQTFQRSSPKEHVCRNWKK